jgi:cell shape-determining protein MreC
LGAAAAPYFQRRQTYTPPFVNINTGSNLGTSTLGAMLPAGAIIGGIY